MSARIGIKEIFRKYKSGEKITSVTAYDAAMAGIADVAGIDLLLVGDSLGMTMLGYETTIPVTLEHSLYHTAAVVRGSSRAMVVGDMPFLTSQITPEQTLINAGRYLQEAGASAVKIEGGKAIAPTAARLIKAGIPVLGHIGILPQSVFTEGGYRIHGREKDEAAGLQSDAKALEDAGVFALVLEGLPTGLSAKITETLSIPTIGIGAGPNCDGQIQVIHDILGLFKKFQPRHSKRFANLGETVHQALMEYQNEVKEGLFPGPEQTVE